MSRLAAAFARARAAGRPAFIPFITAGDPSPSLSVPLLEALQRAGADIVELGVPFSDPIADGPTIQRASARALAQGVGLPRSLAIAASARGRLDCGLVLFTYYNPVLRMGEERFADEASRAGVDGVLVTDLPLEEGARLRALLEDRGVDPILLVAPTTSDDRIAATARAARGFLYLVSRAGVTGARSDLPPGLDRMARAARRAAGVPVAVGFGISTPAQVRAVGAVADGVVVGSALVAAIEAAVAGGRGPDLPALLEEKARALIAGAADDGGDGR